MLRLQLSGGAAPSCVIGVAAVQNCEFDLSALSAALPSGTPFKSLCASQCPNWCSAVHDAAGEHEHEEEEGEAEEVEEDYEMEPEPEPFPEPGVIVEIGEFFDNVTYDITMCGGSQSRQCMHPRSFFLMCLSLNFIFYLRGFPTLFMNFRY